MCGHHYLVEYRPEGDLQGNDWQILERVEMGGGLGISRNRSAEGRERALSLARLHLLADPARAQDIVIQQMSCNGPESDAERPFPLGPRGRIPLVSAGERSLAEEVIRLRKALKDYAAIEVLEGDRGTLRVELPAEGGKEAREALKHGEELFLSTEAAQ